MKYGDVLINTAREELVDYVATAQALREGMLLGAGFDAIEEGIVKDNPLPVLKMWCSHSIWGKHHRQRFNDNALKIA